MKTTCGYPSCDEVDGYQPPSDRVGCLSLLGILAVMWALVFAVVNMF